MLRVAHAVNDEDSANSVTDYDSTNLPEAYDRARDHGPENRALWMRTVAAALDGQAVSRILDLGCGTGRFSPALAEQFDAEVVGVDPSAKMLAIASTKSRDRRVRYCRARAEALPVTSGKIDLVFMSMSYHHVSEPVAAARECRRVLRGGGSVVLRTGTREQIAGYPFTRFFPSLPQILEHMLPDQRALRETFGAAEFDLVAAEVIRQVIAPDWLEYADKLAAGGDSALARLSGEEFQAGVESVRRFGERGDGGPVIEPVDLLVFHAAAAAGR